MKEGGPGGGFHNPMDIFDMFFGTRSHGKRDVGRDMVHQLKVMNSALISQSMKELSHYLGGKIEFSILSKGPLLGISKRAFA